MLIIGEKLNSANTYIRGIIKNRDHETINKIALAQIAGGAHYLDINTAWCNELKDMEWIINNVYEVANVPLCIDSISPDTIINALKIYQGDKSNVIINSISLEKDRIEKILPIAMEYNCKVVALATNDDGIPKTVEERIHLVEILVEILQRKNYDLNKVYIDPLVLPVAIEYRNGKMFLECVIEIKRLFNLNIISGLSNISYSMPEKKLLNRYFLSACIFSGLDAIICDTTDKKITTAIVVSDLLAGNDAYGKNYLKAFRNKQLYD